MSLLSMISILALISEDMQWRLVGWGTGVLAAFWVLLRVRKWRRRRRPPKIHPKLQKYQPTNDDFASNRRAESAKIIATSSGSGLVGYRVLRQVEAVFVDGFRRPEEAVEGLKAVAAMKGANALLHVRHEPIGSGRYSASGDAVIVEATTPEPAPSAAADIGPAVAPQPSVEVDKEDLKPNGENENTDVSNKP